MKNNFVFSILNVLKEGVGDFEDLVVAYLSAGYGASLSKLEYECDKAREARIETTENKEKEMELRRKCSKIIYYLKQNDLITKEENAFKITAGGRKKLNDFKEKKLKSLPSVDYPKGKTPQLVLISFDIPEKERRKRAWLRSVLKNLDFKIVHKSVWVGNFKIPEQFINDLKKINLIDFVEILSVNKKGTLGKIA